MNETLQVKLLPRRISGSIAPRNIIPMAMPAFSKSNFSMAPLLMSSDVAFYRKFNMADAKLEIPESAPNFKTGSRNSMLQGKSIAFKVSTLKA